MNMSMIKDGLTDRGDLEEGSMSAKSFIPEP